MFLAKSKYHILSFEADLMDTNILLYPASTTNFFLFKDIKTTYRFRSYRRIFCVGVPFSTPQILIL